MCNHGENKNDTYIPEMPGEVYMCECGALIDLQNEKNWGDPCHAMTPDEFKAALQTMQGNEYMERVREVLGDYDNRAL